MSSKQNALASCLFEAVDDVNLSNIIVLLEKHGADPNTIIPKLNIAPIHYAVGFDDLKFAEKVTALFLNKKANPNLFSETDQLTPLHIACIWGRPNIVQLLLDSGGDLDLKCNENQTPIMYAVAENHYGVIEVIQKFVFEKKIDKKKKELILNSQSQASCSTPKRVEEMSFSTPVRNNHLKSALQNLEEKKFTPNRINYNFDATSPYFINITHRRHKSSRDRENKVKSEDDDSVDDTKTDENIWSKKNLFELTEKNLKDFSRQMGKVIVIDKLAIHKRRSYIKSWQEKIQQIRKADSKLDVDYINYLNTCNDVTLMKEQTSPPKIDTDESGDSKSSSDSFITAESDLQRFKNAIVSAPEPQRFLEYVEEDYIHSDKDSGVIFFEKKFISKSRVNLQNIDDAELDEVQSLSSVSTKVTLPPLDYDTDTLRKEIKNLTGGNPGPITKNTKKLYLKQLVKLKKRPELVRSKNIEISYSVELQRTLNNFDFLERNLSDFLKLETQMIRHFLERADFKWREGNMKTSFIYLLIDPRLSDNLPLQYKNMNRRDVWTKFLSSIFYVGKGKRSRPYSHLYDAIKLFSMENNQLAERLENRRNQIIEKRVIYSNADTKNEALGVKRNRIVNKVNESRFQESKKLNRIIEIWKSEMGVVCLHIFNNIMPVEAYTREAAIIEAVGIDVLTNQKKGEYYGVAKNFSMRQKRQLGIGLLHRAMNIYLAEVESQLMPFDLI